MKKQHAHMVLLLIDVAAILAIVYVFSLYNDLLTLIGSRAAELSYQSRFTYLFLLGLVPLIHLWSLLEHFFSISQKINRWANRLLLIVFALFIGSAFLMERHIDTRLEQAGYAYCAEQSRSFTFSEYRVYRVSPLQCGSAQSLAPWSGLHKLLRV